MVSWLPLFHDMGMVGFLTIPMAAGAGAGNGHAGGLPDPPAAVAELISRYRGTVTAAPNFAYAVLAALRTHAERRRWTCHAAVRAVNGAEPIDPDAGRGYRGGPVRSASVAWWRPTGWPRPTLGVSFAPLDTGLSIDDVDADRGRPRCAGASPARRRHRPGAGHRCWGRRCRG